ncbi:hypothetical protein GCM10027168_56650 [Streptomyces capparidis]
MAAGPGAPGVRRTPALPARPGVLTGGRPPAAAREHTNPSLYKEDKHPAPRTDNPVRGAAVSGARPGARAPRAARGRPARALL